MKGKQMKKLVLIVALALGLGGCATLGNVYTAATTATVSAGTVVEAANAFDALKATAVNYGQYCVAQKFPQPICSAANRRTVIKAVNSGTAARVQLEASINTGQSALSTVYNTLVAAVNALSASPINTVKGS
jgi:hypothetical protein